MPEGVLMALLTLIIKLSSLVCIGNGIQYSPSHREAASLITSPVRSPMERH